MLEIEIDGKQIQVPDGSTVMDAAPAGRGVHPAFLLPQETLHRRQLPHVSGAGREGTEAAARLRDPGDQRHEGIHALSWPSRRRRA